MPPPSHITYIAYIHMRVLPSFARGPVGSAGGQWDLSGRSCKVYALFTGPLRPSDATPSLRVDGWWPTPPGSPCVRAGSEQLFVSSKSSSRSNRIRRSPRLSLVSPTRIRGSPSPPFAYPLGPPWQPASGPEDRSPHPSLCVMITPSGHPDSPRQDPRTALPTPLFV